MQGFKQHIISLMLSAAMLTLAAACSLIYDEPVEEPEAGKEAGTVSLTFSVPKAVATGANSGEGERWGDIYNSATGTSFDLSVYSDMLHLAVYDASGKYKGEVSKIFFNKIDGTNGSNKYSYLGKLPDGLSDATTYRVMAFANAPGYTDAESYSVAAANFDLSQLQPSAGIVPMWGVVSGQFQTGKRTNFTEELQLLRAVSKTYVTLDATTIQAGFSIKSATLKLPAAQGKIVPENWRGVSSTKEVYFRHDVSNVYPPALNPAAGTEMTQTFYRQGSNAWVVYTPEYNNAAGDAVISFTLTRDGEDYTMENTPFQIFYRDYTKPEGAYFDIARNHIYTFEVGIDTRSGLFIEVRQWDAAYDNNYIFE